MADHQFITVEHRGHVAVLTLSNPERLNALSAAMREEVAKALEALRADDEVRAVVLTGAGRGFCAGADLAAGAAVMSEAGPVLATQNEKLDDMGWVGRWASMWAAFDKPVIGAINGVAITGGFEVAIACDILIASENAANLPEAEKVLKTAVERDRENPFAWYQLGVVYAANGDMARARLASAEQQIMQLRQVIHRDDLEIKGHVAWLTSAPILE